MISERLIYESSLYEGDFVETAGQVRTYNESIDGRNKLNVVIFAREIETGLSEEYFENYIYLEGFLCKSAYQTNLSSGTRYLRPDDRGQQDVQQVRLHTLHSVGTQWRTYAVNLKVGTKVYLEGRIQSREYKKKFEDGTSEIRKAFEISILKLAEDLPGEDEEYCGEYE